MARSGIVMRFDPVPEHPLFGDTYFEDEEEEQEEEDQAGVICINSALGHGYRRPQAQMFSLFCRL